MLSRIPQIYGTPTERNKLFIFHQERFWMIWCVGTSHESLEDLQDMRNKEETGVLLNWMECHMQFEELSYKNTASI